MNLVTDPVVLAGELRAVLLKLGRRLRRELDELDVTPGQVSVLAHLAKHPEIGIRRLAELEGVSAPRMSKLTEEMVVAGLIKRHRGIDRRTVGLAVSNSGHEVLEAVKRHRTAWLAERLQTLGADELDRVEAALPVLAKLLEEPQ